jgi:hypothetical protein
MDRSTAPEKNGSWHNSQHNYWPICGSVPCFSPEPAIEVVGVKSPSVDVRLLGLLGSYHQYVIGTFNTCSQGPTHQSLTDTGEDYNLGGACLPHHTPRPSPSTVSTFHLRAPPGLRLSIQQLPIDLMREQTLHLVSGRLHSTSIVIYHLSIAWANDEPQGDRINKDKQEGQS